MKIIKGTLGPRCELGDGVAGYATISTDGDYRYALTRSFGEPSAHAPVLFIMLNPSTADAEEDDNTIRRLTGFAKLWGRKGFCVGNLYAYRTKEPDVMHAQEDPVGPLNDWWLKELLDAHDAVVCAWGADADPERVQEFLKLARGRRLLCMGLTKKGHPKHPLFLRKDTELMVYREGV